ncbi:MAG: M28 family peptidase [Clostridia bacterium]|nr:M28 family peptidase [Clostridia bacterium]
MTETTKHIFEKYQIRKTGAQKRAFIACIESLAQTWGYSCRVEKGWMGAGNIVIGDPAKAKVIYTAHYDTCPRLPFPNFITPGHFWIYLLYQIAVVIGFMLLPMAAFVCIVLSLASAFDWNSEISAMIAVLGGYGIMLIFSLLILFGPANRHTANDNTSGVTVLTELMEAMPEEYRDDAAYIFFDLEEMGLFGSGGYAAKHKNEIKGKPVINFDCVSDGETILLAVQKRAAAYMDTLEKAFVPTETVSVAIRNRGVFYPSDQMNFPCGIGVAALKRTKRGNILYMNRIHTNRDTVYREENIAYLKGSAVRLTALL